MDTKPLNKTGKQSKKKAETNTVFNDVPKKVVVSEVWANNNLLPKNHGRQLEAAEPETAAEADSLMGRLAKRMASRDMIDEINLGPKGGAKGVKEAQVADYLNEIPGKMHFGMGLHEQIKTIKADDSIQKTMQNPGSTMRQQALNLAKGEAKLKGGEVPDHNFNPESLNTGIKIEKEHTDNLNLAKQIAKGHLLEDPDYYRKLKKAGL